MEMSLKNMLDRDKLIEYLKFFGWSEDKANQFLDDKVGIRALRIPVEYLVDVFKAAIQEGVPFGDVHVQFMVSESNWEAFKSQTEKAINDKGGFLLTEEQEATLYQTDSKTKH